MASIKPLEDKIVVQASEAETTTASGIVIPTPPRRSPRGQGPGRRPVASTTRATASPSTCRK
ncbi:hypothetical protein [Saccharopolyspora gregorii]|uniref:hypothetical protein n=1 Tax=Saccharopolyspora gregorii TaxID=33914 RepID=UPI003CD06117